MSDPNWYVLVPIVAGILVAGILVVGVAEIVGVVRHGDHRLDTISELWWTLRNRLGGFRAALALPLAAVLLWTWWHLTFEGRRRLPHRRRTEIPPRAPDDYR